MTLILLSYRCNTVSSAAPAMPNSATIDAEAWSTHCIFMPPAPTSYCRRGVQQHWHITAADSNSTATAACLLCDDCNVCGWRLQVNQLYVIGGDGTHRAAQKIAAECLAQRLNIAVAGVPKVRWSCHMLSQKQLFCIMRCV
jgi:hypothetical protein